MKRKIEGSKYLFYDGDALILTMALSLKDNTVEILLQGQLRSDAAHSLQDDLIAMVLMGKDIVLDFKDVTYMAPSIQYVLQLTQQKIDTQKKGSLLLRRLPENICQELEETGALEQLKIEE